MINHQPIFTNVQLPKVKNQCSRGNARAIKERNKYNLRIEKHMISNYFLRDLSIYDNSNKETINSQQPKGQKNNLNKRRQNYRGKTKKKKLL